MPITLQGTAGGFSAEFIGKLPELEAAMATRGLDANDFIISKDEAASAVARPLGPFFYDYTVFVGEEHFTEPNDARFHAYFMDRILAADEAPAPRSHDTAFSRFCKMDGAADLKLSRRHCGARRRRRSSHVFFGFIAVIFMALLMCIAQPAMSFCDIDDFADVISCIAAVLLSPSGIFMTAASALAMPSVEQPAVFDLARAGAAASAIAARAAQTVLEIMSVPRNRSRPVAGHEKRRLPIRVP